MNRNLVTGIAAFALLVGASLMMAETAQAGHCGGGLFSRLHANRCGGGGLFSGHHRKGGCGGGLFSRLHARHASCCEPAPAPAPCCEPAPAPCAPAPCEPAPAPCYEPASACGGCGGSACGGCGGCAEPACGGCATPTMDCGACGGAMMTSPEGYDLAPGESVVPGSVQTMPAEGGEAVESQSDAPAAGDEAPPAPTPDANTDA